MENINGPTSNGFLSFQQVWNDLSGDIRKAIQKNAYMFSPGFPRKSFVTGFVGLALFAFAGIIFSVFLDKRGNEFIFMSFILLCSSIAVVWHAKVLYQNQDLINEACGLMFLAQFLGSHQCKFTEDFKKFLYSESVIVNIQKRALSLLDEYSSKTGIVMLNPHSRLVEEGKQALLEWQKSRTDFYYAEREIPTHVLSSLTYYFKVMPKRSVYLDLSDPASPIK